MQSSDTSIAQIYKIIVKAPEEYAARGMRRGRYFCRKNHKTMKHTAKAIREISVTAPGAPDSITNLRRDADNPAILRPVGEPRQLADSAALPAGSVVVGDRQIIFWADGRELWAETAGATEGDAAAIGPASRRRRIATLPAEPLLFHAVSPGVVRVMLRHSAPVYLTCDSAMNISYAGPVPRFSALTIGTTATETLRAAIPTCLLTGVAGHGTGSVDADDAETLRKAGLAAYASLRGVARRTGRFLQPVLARYRITDAAGVTLFCGPWVIPSAAEGFQCAGQLKVSCDADSGQTAAGAIEGRGYLLSVAAIAQMTEPWRSLAARLVIEVTDEIEPVDTDGEPGTGTIAANPRGTLTVSWYLPGCTSEKAGNPGLRAPLVADALARAEQTCRTALVIDDPFKGTAAQTIGVPSSTRLTDATETAPAVGETYSTALEAGDMLLLGNPRRQAAVLPAGADYAIAVSSGNAEMTLSPLLTVADADATRLILRAKASDGTVTDLTYPLRRVPGSELAYWLADDLKPVETGRVTSVTIDSGRSAVPRYGQLVCAAVSTPDRITDRLTVCRGEIVALTQAMRTGAGWDFSRRRIMVFSPTGIWQTSVSPAGKLYGAALLDMRGVASGRAVTAATDHKGTPCVCAVADGDLIRIGATSSATLLRRCGATALGWAGRYGELWVCAPDGITLLNMHSERVHRLSDLLAPDDIRLRGHGGRLLVATAGALFDACDEIPAETTACRLSCRLTPGAHPMPLWLKAAISAAEVTGRIDITGDDGSRVESPLMSVGLHGALNSPVCLPVTAPRRRHITVSADLRLSADATVDSIIIANFGS